MTQNASNPPSKPTQPTANTTGQDTATAKSLWHPLKPSNSATTAQYAAENSPKASSNGSKNSPTAHADYKREGAPSFMRLLPLSEIIAAVMGTDSPATQAVWKPYNALIERFGNEYSVLIDAPVDAMASVVDPAIAQAIMKVRDGTAKVTPGYDGVYGQLALGIEPLKVKAKAPVAHVQQRSMSDFW